MYPWDWPNVSMGRGASAVTGFGRFDHSGAPSASSNSGTSMTGNGAGGSGIFTSGRGLAITGRNAENFFVTPPGLPTPAHSALGRPNSGLSMTGNGAGGSGIFTSGRCLAITARNAKYFFVSAPDSLTGES